MADNITVVIEGQQEKSISLTGFLDDLPDLEMDRLPKIMDDLPEL